MIDLWNYLKETNKPIALYGMGNAAERIIKKLNSINKKPCGIFASDGFARHNLFCGYTVKTFSEICNEFGTDIIVLVSFGTSLKEVMDNIYRISSICETYAPCLSVIGDSYFNLDYYEENKNIILDIRKKLADETSKRTLDNIIEYKITGKIDILKSSETLEEETWEIVKPKEGDIYLDLGAYTGDTLKKYIEHNPGYSKCIAVEPDKRSFRKMNANLEGIRDINLIHGAVSNYDHIGTFLNLGGRQSKIGNNGEDIMIYSVDGILNGSRVDYINIDTEGEEINVLNGSIKTIRSYYPTMLVSAYHKATDIIDIPLLMQKIAPEYKIYMRHYPYIPDWDTVYIFKK